MREGEVGVDRKPRDRPVFVRELDPDALARAACLGVAGIARKQDLGCLVEHEHRDRAVEARDDLGADADLGALRAHEERRRVELGRGIGRIFGDGDAAGVVAVVAATGADIELGLVERTEHHGELRASDGHGGVSRIGRVEDGVDVRREQIAPPAHHRSKPAGPVENVLRVDGGAALLHVCLLYTSRCV